MIHLHRVALVAFLLLISTVHAAEQTFYLPLQGHLTIDASDEWKVEYLKGNYEPPTLRLQRGGQDPAVMTLKPMRPEGSAVPSNQEVLLLSGEVFKPLADRSVEKTGGRAMQFQNLPEPNFGVLATYTEAKPDAFTHVTGALVRVGKELIRVQVQHNGKDAAAVTDARAILAAMRLTPATPIRRGNGASELIVDGRWNAAAPEVDFAKKTTVITAVDESRGWTATVNLVPAQPKPQDAGDAKDSDRARAYFLSTLKVEGASESTVAYCSVAEWSVGDEKHALSAYAADGTWFAVHFVKPRFDEKTDRPVLDELLNGVAVKRIAQPPKKKLGGKK